MAITTVDGVVGAAKQRIELYKTASRTTVAGGWFCNFDIAGNPGAGTLAVGNTANGIVPTDVSPSTGYPIINAFGGSRGYISRAAFKNSVICQIRVFDAVFSCGAYNFNANTNLASQPSFSARVSLNGGAANYNGLELWAEQVGAATGNQTANVSYLDQDGGGGTTGAVGIGAAPTAGRCWLLPLASGDSGVSGITNVTGGTASAGTFNVHVLRPLIDIYIPVANQLVIQNWADLGLPQIFADSAIKVLLNSPAGTALGTMDIANIDIING